LDSQATALVVLYHKIDLSQCSTTTEFSGDIAPLRVYQFFFFFFFFFFY